MGRNNEEYHTEKVVVITGSTFGSSLKLVLWGMLLGAAGTLYWQRQKETGESSVSQQKEKAKLLMQRVANLAQRTRELAHIATESFMPQWEEAKEAAKSTAQETEYELQKVIEEEVNEPHLKA